VLAAAACLVVEARGAWVWQDPEEAHLHGKRGISCEPGGSQLPHLAPGSRWSPMQMIAAHIIRTQPPSS
jgi:hypothetical protein